MAIEHRQSRAAIATATLLGMPFGMIYAFSVLLQPLEALLGVARSELAVVFGLSAIGFTAGMNLAPSLFGRIPAPALLAFSTVATTGGMALAAMARGTLELALGYGLLFGVASGMAFSVSQQSVNLTVRRHRGLVNGYVVSLFPAGAMVGAPLLGWAIEAWGVRASLSCLAAVFAVTGLMSVGLFTWGGVLLRVPEKREAATDAGKERLRAVFWKIFAVFFLAAAAGLMVLSQAAGIVAAYGGGSTLALLATTGITGAIAVARIAGGWLTDRFPVPSVMAAAQALALAGTVVLTLWPSPGIAVVSLAMMGMGYGLISGSTAGAIGRYWAKSDYGRIVSRTYIAWCIAAVSLPVLAARLFDLTGGYSTAVIVAGVGNLCGVLIAASLPHRGEATSDARTP